MFVCNLNLNFKKIAKLFFLFIFFIVLLLCVVIAYNIFFKSNFTKDTISSSTCEIDSKNYTNVLNEVHNNIDNYIGKKIKFSGYVYRVYDFTDNQFVLARNMIISSDFQTVVVGFLCESELAKNYNDNTWVEIEGTITKGIYHEEIPIIKITNIKETAKPQDEFVYPPDSTFVPTNDII